MNARWIAALVLAGRALSASSLSEQSMALALEHSFPSPALSYILLEAPSGRLICSRWNGSDVAVPVGSLVKPFTALAYGKTHGFVFPHSTCQGEQDHCWLPQGHGRISLADGIAHSCNAYFLGLAAEVNADVLAAVAQQFGLKPPEAKAPASAFIGVGDQWPGGAFDAQLLRTEEG